MTTSKFTLLGVDKIPTQSGYSPSFTQGFSIVALNGGYPQVRAINRTQPVPISATYQLGSVQEADAFYIWYSAVIKYGSEKFIALLDVDGELKEYVCQLAPNSPPVYGGYKGYNTSVTLDMLVVVDRDIAALDETYQWNSLYTTPEEFLSVFGLINDSLYPMEYPL